MFGSFCLVSFWKQSLGNTAIVKDCNLNDDTTKNSKKKSKNKQKEAFKPADNCLDHDWIADVIVYDNVTGLKSVQNLQNGNFVDENLLIGSRQTNVVTVKGGLISERCFTSRPRKNVWTHYSQFFNLP